MDFNFEFVKLLQTMIYNIMCNYSWTRQDLSQVNLYRTFLAEYTYLKIIEITNFITKHFPNFIVGTLSWLKNIMSV